MVNQDCALFFLFMLIGMIVFLFGGFGLLQLKIRINN